MRILEIIRWQATSRPYWFGVAIVVSLSLVACGEAAPVPDERTTPTPPSPVTAAASLVIPALTQPTSVPVATSTQIPVPAASPTTEPVPVFSPVHTATRTATPAPAHTPSPTAEPVPPLTFEFGPGTVARYLVKEQLASLDLPNDAIGETTGVSGRIVFAADGSVLPDMSVIKIDMQALKSGSAKRDKYLRGKSLESDLYPEAVFVLTGVIGLAWPLPIGEPLDFEMTGEMTVRDVTRPVTWTTVALFDGDSISGRASTRFTFGDFQMKVPSVFVVISVEDDIRLELDFVATLMHAQQ